MMPPVISGFVTTQPKALTCQLVVTGPATAGVLEAMQARATAILPQCDRFVLSQAQLLVELSVTRRASEIEIVIPDPAQTPAVVASKRRKRHRHGVVYGLRLRAENTATHEQVADVRAEQHARRPLKSAQEAALLDALAVIAGHQNGNLGP